MPVRRAGRGEIPKAAARIPSTVWMLGFVSMFMDISSEMIHALLPVFLVSVLGASALAVGAIEGIDRQHHEGPLRRAVGPRTAPLAPESGGERDGGPSSPQPGCARGPTAPPLA